MNLRVGAPILPVRPEVFHREMPWIALSSSAEMPPGGSEIRAGERRRLLHDILECERCLAVAASLVRWRETPSGEAIDPQEVRNGWRKFFLAHGVFFHTFALLADLYRQCTVALEEGGCPQRQIDQIASLWRLAGSLMLYGIDFSPAETIYQQYIRPQMPDAFSGTWLREYALLSGRRRGLDRALKEKADLHGELVRDLRARLAEGEKVYHTLHFRVMVTCVPDLTSKLQEYQLEHGKLTLDEGHFQIYDEWFHVLRLPDIDLSSYVRSVSALLSELLADLVEGTYLEPEPLAQLTSGISTMLEILCAAVGQEPVPQEE